MAVTQPAAPSTPAPAPASAPAPAPVPGPVPALAASPGGLAHRYAALAPPLEVGLAALRLEALLGDPRDAANPYGLPALAAAPAGSAAPAAPAGSAGSAGVGEGRAGRAALLLAAAGLGQVRAADQWVRALRPLLRRDLALGHAVGASGASGASGAPLAGRARGQVAESCPVPAALLGPAALVAAVGSVLRQAALTVAGCGRGGGEPDDLRQWQPVLAAAFADLLACESLTCVALRRPAAPSPGPGPGPGSGSGPGSGLGPGPGSGLGPGSGPGSGLGPGSGSGSGSGPGSGFGRGVGAGLLGAVAGYVVPTVLADVLAQLGLVLAECGHGPASTGGRMLAKLIRDLPLAGVDAAGAAYWQARLARALPALAAEEPRAPYRGPAPAPFRLADPPAPAPVPVPVSVSAAGVAAVGEQGDGYTPDGHGSGRFTPHGHEPGGAQPGGDGPGGDSVVLSGLLRAGAARPEGVDADRVALGALARRLLTEQRALRRPCRTAGVDPGAPVARALADRQALLWLAAAVLGVREAADDGRGLFLGGTHWALLALSGIAGRLGVPLPGPVPDPRAAVWAELAGRVRHGVDCDVYATRLLW
ncbi:hypothetical protein ACIOHS_45990 [Streptomyces sp. NPDC088253]|uniref:hypothetical protein n=1 Tax=Streptomyces sp. NPDC088253 TaxID=3365846 RepID=UPI00381E31F3